jgi:F-type H+-transporting ATPase subunit a
LSGKGCLYIAIGLLLTLGLCGLSSGFLAALGTGTLLDGLAKPVLPSILLPAEKIPGLGGITNTLIATVLADIVILLLFGLGTQSLRRQEQAALVPVSRLQNLVEILIEAVYGLAESILGERARKVFWLGATIFIFILVANWMELIPGFDSIGIIEEAHEGLEGAEKGSFLGIPALVGPLEENGGEGEHQAHGYVLVPILRAANTDLNTTLALALIAMVMVQVYGIRELGAKEYFGKFMQTQRIGDGNPMGLIDLFVGILESISEVAKIISFTFRLFGNIFAGQVLLFVMSFLIPFLVFGVLIFWGLEIFVGAIQALVFMMLTFVFLSMAMAGHGGHEEDH